jgi:phosphate starvation-inducible protein PhoH
MSHPRRQRLSLVNHSPYDTPSEVVESKHKIKIADLKQITAQTTNQQTFFNLYRKGHPALLVHGVAGSGKTYLALFSAFNEILQPNINYQKVVIVRSAVPSRDIGHLPGDAKEKTEVYVQPYRNLCAELFPRFGEKAFNKLKEQQLVEFMVTSFVRGITLDNSIIIVDECQNMCDMELNSIMTRVGQNSKIIFCGDFRQTDLNRKNDASGLQKFMSIIDHMPAFRQVEFGVEDIQRSKIVKEYIIARMAIEDLAFA